MLMFLQLDTAVQTRTPRSLGCCAARARAAFRTTCNAARLSWLEDAAVIEVELVDRDYDVPQVDLVEPLWTLPPDFYMTPRGAPT